MFEHPFISFGKQMTEGFDIEVRKVTILAMTDESWRCNAKGKGFVNEAVPKENDEDLRVQVI